MSNAEKRFLILLKNGIFNTTELLPETDLHEVEQLAVNHLCVPLVYQGAVNGGIAPSGEWKNAMLKTLYRNESNLRVQNQVIQKFIEANIPCAVLKGSSVAVFYANPYLRPLGDIDILVRPCDYEKAISILDTGENKDNNHEHKFHCKLMVNGISVEVHQYITEPMDDSYGKKIDSFMNYALDKVEYAEYEGFRFPVLSAKHQAITLLLHMQRHFYENRLTMRMLCDWAAFINSIHIDEWENNIKPYINELGLGKLSDTLTSVCNHYLGTNAADKMINSSDDSLCEDIIHEFLSNGVLPTGNQTSRNFGNIYALCKQKTNNKCLALLFSVNEIARHNFKLARHPVFLPLFWIYIPIRYFVRWLTGKRGILSFDEFNETAERRKRIYQKLDL